MTLNDIKVSSVPDRGLKYLFLTAFSCMNLHTSYAVLRWVYKTDKNDVQGSHYILKRLRVEGGKKKLTEGEGDKKEVIICEYRPRFGKRSSAQKKHVLLPVQKYVA